MFRCRNMFLKFVRYKNISQPISKIKNNNPFEKKEQNNVTGKNENNSTGNNENNKNKNKKEEKSPKRRIIIWPS